MTATLGIKITTGIYWTHPKHIVEVVPMAECGGGRSKIESSCCKGGIFPVLAETVVMQEETLKDLVIFLSQVWKGSFIGTYYSNQQL